METIIINGRFNGPPDSGNGGYVCGLIANHLQGTTQVTLRKPPPLDRPLTVKKSADNRISIQDNAILIAEAQPATIDFDVPQPPTFAAAETAVANYTGFHFHIFPSCFVCGPQRDLNDGLNVFAGQVAGQKMVASPWLPDDSLVDEAGFVKPEFFWAALDCPGYFALFGGERRPAVLGQMTAEIYQPLRSGSQNIIIGWEIARDGRKGYAGTAVFSDSGTLCAKAQSTWIEIQV